MIRISRRDDNRRDGELVNNESASREGNSEGHDTGFSKFGDAPVKSRQEDLLGRAQFATMLARHLLGTYPVVLVGGALLRFVPGLSEVKLDHEVVVVGRSIRG